MKLIKAILTLMVGAFFLVCCDTADNVNPDFKNFFVKYYGNDGEQRGVDLILEDDGNILMLGNSEFPVGTKRAYLVKVNQEGSIIWERKLGGTQDEAKDIEQLNDGNYIILINTIKSNDQHAIKLLKVNAIGTPIDSVLYDYSASQFANAVTALSDGGYIVTGNRPDDNTDGSDPQLPGDDIEDIITIRFNNSYDTLWTWKFNGGEFFGAGIKVFEQPNKQFYFFGYSDRITDNDNAFELNFWFTTISPDGLVVNSVSAGSNNEAEVVAAVSQDPTGYLAVGTATNALNVKSLYVTKFKRSITGTDFVFNRKVLTQKELVAVNTAPSVIGNGGHLIVANETVPETGLKNIWLGKIDLSGNLLWSASFGSKGNDDYAKTVVELPDGRILVLGTMRLENQDKMALIKLNNQGKLLD
jgi:hypothetical protein